MATSPPHARRIYLTERLVNKQITMEEATELFTLMSREMDRLRKQVTSGAIPPPPAAMAAPGTTSPPSPGSRPAALDNLEEVLLFGGPLLGVLAAIIKRSGLDALAPPPAAARPKDLTRPGSTGGSSAGPSE